MESHDERTLLQPVDAQNRRDRRVQFLFLLMGAASVISYNAVVMAIAYFRLDGGLGRSVLPNIARCHNTLLVITMLTLLCAPFQPKLSQHIIWLVVAYVTAASVDALLLVTAAQRDTLNSTILYTLVALNGAATGISQSMGASVSGIFDTYSQTKGVGLAQIRGFALGVALPTLVQLLFLPLVGLLSLNLAAALSAAFTALVALALVASAIASTCLVARTPTFRRNVCLERAGQPIESQTLCNNPESDSIGKCVMHGPETRAFLRERFAKVLPLASAQFINTFALLIALLFSTRLPIVEDSFLGSTSFWKAYLPTLVIAANNIFTYIGRSIVRPPPRQGAIWPLAYLLIAPTGLGLAFFYRHTQGSCLIGLHSNLWPILLYSIVAVGVGRATVIFSQLAQLLCGHTSEFPCPIVAQINVIAVEAGACAGSFAFS